MQFHVIKCGNVTTAMCTITPLHKNLHMSVSHPPPRRVVFLITKDRYSLAETVSA